MAANQPAWRGRAEVRRAWKDTLRANAALLTIALLAGLAFIAGVGMLPFPEGALWFLVGFMLALWLLSLAFTVHSVAGTYGRLLGVQAEKYTADAVCRRSQRRKGWRIVHGLYYRRHGDVDHVLIGPGGVYAIETKWTTEAWSIEDGRLVTDRRRCPVDQARASARIVEVQLCSGRQRLEVAVTPVLVIWGPGAPEFDEARVLDGVVVLAGRHHRRWGQVFDRTTVRPDVVADVHQLLADHQQKQQEWTSAHRAEVLGRRRSPRRVSLSG